MGKYTSAGIDWIDVTTLMCGLQGIHEVNVELTITTVTQGHSGLLRISALAWTPTVEAHGTKEIAQVAGSWPDSVHPSFDSAVFALLYELDRAIGKSYEQTKIE